jgi:hypothetical protein
VIDLVVRTRHEPGVVDKNVKSQPELHEGRDETPHRVKAPQVKFLNSDDRSRGSHQIAGNMPCASFISGANNYRCSRRCERAEHLEPDAGSRSCDYNAFFVHIWAFEQYIAPRRLCSESTGPFPSSEVADGPPATRLTVWHALLWRFE